MSFRVEQAGGHRRQPRCAANASSGIAGVEGAVTDGRSPAKRSLDGVRNAHTLNGLGLVAAFRGQCQSPSGGQDFTALGGGARGGGARRAWQRHPPRRSRFHTKRPKPLPGLCRFVWNRSCSDIFSFLNAMLFASLSNVPPTVAGSPAAVMHPGYIPHPGSVPRL